MAIFQFYVRIKTGTGDDADTDDRMFLGIFGKAGGREFAINSDENDFQSGDNVSFTYGNPLSMTSIDPVLVNPIEAVDSGRNTGEFNDPELLPLSLDLIEYVYVRKAGARLQTDDNRFELEEAEAKFWDFTGGVKTVRTFRFSPPSPLFLGNESGLQVWLVEER